MMRDIPALVLLVLTALLLRLLLRELVFTDDVYYAALSDNLSIDRIEELLKNRKELAWVSYVFTPVFYLLKIFLTTVCLYIGIFLLRERVSFAALFSVCIYAEFVFLIPIAIRLFWFTLVDTHYVLAEVSDFPPASLYNLIGSDFNDDWIKYPLRVLNLFELVYILVLCHGISKRFELNFTESLKLVFASYVPGLVLWIITIVFLLIN